jgi:hypothetical protein
VAAPIKASARLRENPFYVLALPISATRVEVEREAQKLLGMLELGLATAARYASPLGWHPRTPDLVRAAAAALRDPRRRLLAEAWARHAPPVAAAGDQADAGAAAAAEVAFDPDAAAPGWEDARAILGWSRGGWR